MKVSVILRQSEGEVATIELTLQGLESEQSFQQWAHTVCWQGLNAEGIYIPANNIAFIRRIAEFTLSDDDDKVVRLKQ